MDNNTRDKNKGDTCGSKIKKDNEHLAFIKMKSVKTAKEGELKVEFVHPTAAQNIFKQQIVDKFEGEFAADEKPEFDEFPGSAVDDTLEIHGTLSKDGVIDDDADYGETGSDTENDNDLTESEELLSDIDEEQEQEEESHAKPFIVYPVIKNGRQVNGAISDNETVLSENTETDSEKTEILTTDKDIDELLNIIKDDNEALSLTEEKNEFDNIGYYNNKDGSYAALCNVASEKEIQKEGLGSDMEITETNRNLKAKDLPSDYDKENNGKSDYEKVIEKSEHDNEVSSVENICTKEEDKTMKTDSELKLKVKPENLISADKLLIVKRNSIKEEAEMSESAIKEKAKAVKDYKSKKETNTISDIKDKTEQNEKKFKVLFVSPEVAPFIHTGGLGEVSYALPVALAEKNVDIRVILPLYSAISEEYKKRMKYIGNTYVNLAWRYQYAGVFELKKDGVIYYFIDNEFYFKRDGIYGHFDDGERFAFFSKAVLELLRVIDFYPDVIHSNDWQSALVPVFLDAFYRGIEEYKNIRTLFTIHNIQYQGKYDKEVVRDILGLGSRANWVMMDNCCNYMKGAIECAKAVSTVSKAYVGEIMDPYFSYGLDSILRERSYKISGILNGIDNNIFNPETDKKIIKNYNYETIQYKKDNKKALLEKIGLQYDENRPLISMVSRLTEQKGIDLLLATADKILSADLQLVILGKGDWKYEKAISDIQYRYSNKVRAIIDFSDEMARQIYAGSDIFLMPSKYEPCGLSQMISMRYGTVPIVRETGGLKDSVVPFNITDKSGTGFTFYSYNSYDMLDAIWRAFATYFDKDSWSALIKNIMSADFGWDKQSEEYLNLYKSL